MLCGNLSGFVTNHSSHGECYSTDLDRYEIPEPGMVSSKFSTDANANQYQH